MAILHPETLAHVRQNAGLFRELDVLDRLKQSLPDDYEIFHSVSWHSISHDQDSFGEIDIVVIGPRGGVLLLEVKAGDVSLRNGEFYKLYQGKDKNVSRQSRIQYAAMKNRLEEAGLNPYLANCLVLPDYRLDGAAPVAFPRDRILAANQYDMIGTRVREILGASIHAENRAALRHFFMNEFKVVADLSPLRSQIQHATHLLSDGMATWIPRITSPSGVIRIQGTAGSGKTQLALQLLADAANSGQKSLYVCFNRPLADHMVELAPPQALVTNFHELCIDHYRRALGDPDFSDPRIFGQATQLYLDHANRQEPRFDMVIIDEGQDMDPAWVECLIGQLKPDGRLYLMEDEDQRLYERDGFDLGGAVGVCSQENFRSPRAICDVINALGLASSPVIAKSPYQGDYPDLRQYQQPADLKPATAAAVEAMQARGFALEDIVVLTWHGRRNSRLLDAERIGPHRTKRFTGEYTADGNPIWTDGDLRVETVYRFKGQSAAAVILSEIDFEQMSETDRKKLFVGLTRAQMAAEIVISPTAGEWFRKKLS